MKRKNTFLIRTLIVLLTFSICSFKSFASDNKGSESQGFSKEEIKQLLIDYAEVLEDKEKLMTVEYLSEEVKNASLMRLEGLRRMEDRIGAAFDKVVFLFHPDTIREVDNGVVAVNVYETTAIQYSCGNQASTTDVMAFGVWHELELQPDNGRLIITKDSFDESDVTGVVSGMSADRSNTAVFEPEEENNILTEAGINATAASYQVNQAMAYAIQYCGISEADRLGYEFASISSGTNHASNYNTLYYNFNSSGGDCCNFVSQCIHAGGIAQDSVWYYTTNSSGKRVGTYTWTNTQYFHNHFSPTYLSSLVNSSYSNIYPGNPVYWLQSEGNSTNHNMLCVGKNSAGVPVVCAHNSDLYRVPVSNYSDKSNLRTMRISTTSSHSHSYTYKYNSYKHYRVCSHCEYLYSSGVHTVNLAGNCSVCGAHGPFETPLE